MATSLLCGFDEMEVMADRPGDYLGIDEEFMSPDGFSTRRKAKLQRSQDSGALTDWSRSSPSRRSGCSSGSSSGDEKVKFVTVLSVNGGLILDPTVTPQIQLEGGTTSVTAIPVMKTTGGICLSSSGFMEEVVCIVRRHGQKLGFGLKFDGGIETDRPVQRLFIQCCAESSPAAAVRCSWGRLVEADQIIQIDGEDIRSLTRLQVVRKLTEGADVLSLKIRHYWDEKERANIVQHLGSSCPSPPITVQPASHKIIKAVVLQERAVDVPEEFLLATAPPVAPPRRRRRNNRDDSVPSRSLSSDEVLVNGQRISVPSKPPRIVRSSRSFNSKKTVAELEQSSGASTLPRSCQKEPQRHCSILTINQDEPLIPPAAEVYVNLIAEEDQRVAAAAAESSAESDTCSSVSTVLGWSTTCGSEVEEYREEIKVEQQQQQQCLPPSTTEELLLLIQPPATFLDEHSSDDGQKQQDASSDSGASSGGSELQLVEVDSDCEELKVFQQVENAIYQSREELTVDEPPTPTRTVTLRAPTTSSKITPKGAIKAPVVKTNSNSTLDSKLVMNNSDKATTTAPSRLPVNRATPIRSRIPQAVSAVSPTIKPVSAAKLNSNARPTVNNRPSAATASSNTIPSKGIVTRTARTSDVVIINNPKTALMSSNKTSGVKLGLVQSRIPRPSSSSKISSPMSSPATRLAAASAKSSSRLNLTHNKGESDLVSTH